MEIRLAQNDPSQRIIACHEGKFFFGHGVLDRQPLPGCVSWLSLGMALRLPDYREFWGARA